MLLADPPSSTTKVTSRGEADGLSLLLLYFIARNAAWNCATVPELSGEVRVNTPVDELKLAVILPVLAFDVKVSESSPETKLVIETVAELNILLSTSLNVMPELTIVAA